MASYSWVVKVVVVVVALTCQMVWAEDDIASSSAESSETTGTRGWTFETALTVDIISNLSGGLDQGTDVLENLDIQLTLDLDTMIGWSGTTLFMYGLANHGDSPSETVGDFQVLDNIDAPQHASIYELWLEKLLLGGKLSLKLGLYDFNSEFDCTETGGLFLNSSFGIGPDFSQTGKNGPSIFPVTSLSLRAAVSLTDNIYWQAVVADGVPGDPEDGPGTHISIGSDDGILFLTEVGMLDDDSLGKIALGAWYYSAEEDEDAAGNPIEPTHNHGFYVVGETAIFLEEDSSQGLTVSGRVGIADATINQVETYLGGGLVYTGLVRNRDQDRVGLAIAHARTSGNYRSAVGAEDHETAIELSYAAEITNWLTLQPDIQYIINPGMDPALDDAFVVGLRVVLSSILE